MTTAAILPESIGGVLVASPNTSLRERVLDSLHDQRCPVQEATGGADALVKLEHGDWRILFLDRCLPDLDSEELIRIIKSRFPGIEVVLLDPDGGQPLAALAGSRRSETAAYSSAAEADPAACREDALSASCRPLPHMVGCAEPMLRLYRLARLIAPHNTTVLILGASGTGKELVARGIHAVSPRAPKPFVVVNCAAIPETLLESELFGYVRGAFTGAVQSQAGRIQAAQGGTLFLDEVGELPLSMQAKLLRFLEQKEIQRLGSTETARVDARVIAATNADLAAKVEVGAFREDLYYRLAAFPLEIPPLAQRVADIVPLAQHFLDGLAASGDSRPLQLSASAGRALEARAWRGNVRELQHVMERAAILADGAEVIQPVHLEGPFLSLAGRNPRSFRGDC
jgi:DNA-binding NtrC family response regulator